MRIARLAVHLPLIVLAACASGAPADRPSPEPSFDPAGVYDFAVDAEGEEVTGVMTITGAAEGYGGVVTLNGQSGEAQVESVTRRGDLTVVELDTPDGPATLELNFEGSTFSGLVYLGANAYDISGSRRP